jgi:hypothetical protein
MTQPVQGFFSESINSRDATSKLPNFPAKFSGVVVTDVVKGIITKGERAFIVEFTVESSNMPLVVGVGSRFSWFQKIKAQQESTGEGAILNYLYAALQLDAGRDKVKIEKEVKPQQMAILNAAVSAANPLRGRRVKVETFEKPFKEDKTKMFTVHTYSIAPVAAGPDATAILTT